MTTSACLPRLSLVTFVLLFSSWSRSVMGQTGDIQFTGTNNQDATTEGPFNNNPTHATPTKASCCYGNTTIQHGETALGLPECCMRLVCCNGEIVKNNMVLIGPNYHPDVDPCHMDDHHEHMWDNTTTTPDARTFHDHYSKCCVLGDRMYPQGHILTKFCMRMVCHEGHWDFEGTIDPTCGHCWLHDDPHFTTFDGTHYDWHGLCNYSLAQTDDSYDPYTAVYASFKKCFGRRRGSSLPSCVDRATFRENPNTVVEMNAADPSKITVNGEMVEIPDTHEFKRVTTSHGVHPLLALMLDECAVVIGASGFVVMQCPHRLDVWVQKSFSDGVDGLCGRFNMNDTDDLRSRDAAYLPSNTTLFPLSWLADNTTLKECLTDDADNIKAVRCTSPTDKFVEPCERVTRGNAYLNETCQYDLCKLSQTRGGRKSRKIKLWLKVLQRNAFITEWLDNATRAYMEWE